MIVTEKHILFWGGIFSNWATVPGGISYSDYISGSVVFKTSEHLFMYLKAVYFNDFEIAREIVKTNSPKDVKALGRKVKNFSEEEWEVVREKTMEITIKYKVASWPSFKTELTKDEYKDKTFVEASPYDKIWGIGLGEENPDADDETKWKGLNLLGKTLTKVRDTLI